MMFQNREQAGELLAQKLLEYKGRKDTIVLGIPRGGVVVAKIVSSILQAPLDIIVVKKIGAPGNPELAIGGVASQRTVYWDENLCRRLNISKRVMNRELRIKEKERQEREELLRGNKGWLMLKKKTVILVDDGVATGATVMTAAMFLGKEKVKKAVLATPVIAKDTLVKMNKYFTQTIYLDAPAEFYAVGQFYREFPQVSDEEVVSILSS